MYLHHMGHMTWCNLTWKLITRTKKRVTSNLLQGKDDANKCKPGGITQVD